MSAYVSIRQHTPADVGRHQHTSVYKEVRCPGLLKLVVPLSNLSKSSRPFWKFFDLEPVYIFCRDVKSHSSSGVVTQTPLSPSYFVPRPASYNLDETMFVAGIRRGYQEEFQGCRGSDACVFLPCRCLSLVLCLALLSLHSLVVLAMLGNALE